MAGYIGTKAVNLSTTGADINGDANIDGNLSFGDNNKATFGAGSDLQIYHDGSNSRIADQGTGGLVLQGDAGVYIKSSDNAETMAQFVKDGQVSLWYDNVSKLATSSSGVDIEGTLTSDGLTVNDTLRLDNEDTTVSTGDIFGDIEFYDNDGGSASAGVTAKIEAQAASPYGASSLIFYTSSSSSGARTALTEQMQIDAGGNLLVGKTSANTSTVGVEALSNGEMNATVNGGRVISLDRLGSDGDIVRLRKSSSTVGVISATAGDLAIGTGDTGLRFNDGGNSIISHNVSTNNPVDNAIDLGQSGYRWDDIYATNGTIQTSDRNEKQDIAELSDAEQRAAVAAKGLMRKFRWRDAVEAKGDDARTHFGIIAQDLQAAFAAEGLDAGDYAMFISSTWWEHDVEVPAVEAVAEVLDEEGNVVTEAVEAKDAYTRTDTYDTQEEAPEGATERTRLGVRYSELLAFIIGAL
jgi:hypothetical protein